MPTRGCGFEEAWAGCLADGRSPGLWGALDAFYVRDAVEGICEHASLRGAGGGGGWGGSAVGKARRRFRDSGTALTTTLHWRLSTLATHTSTSSSHGGGVGGTNVGSGRSMTPAMTDCEARALVQWIGPSSETRPKYASDVERAATAHRSVVYCFSVYSTGVPRTRRRASTSTNRS